MDALTLKIILMFVMFALSAFFGLIPIKLLQYLRKRAASTDITEHKWPSLILCLLSCFTGGVFLSTCFLHLLPDVIKDMAGVRCIYNWDVAYPIAEFISCCGFFLVFFIEELVLCCFHQRGHSHGASPGNGVVHVHVVHNHDERPERNAEDDAGYVAKYEHKGAMLKNNDRLTDFAHSLSPECPEGCSGVELTVSAEPECCEGPCDGRDEDPPILMGYRPHAHSHSVRSITLVVALSFHSVIEGLALGIQSNVDGVATLFISIIIHKCIVLFSTGVQLARTHAHRLHLVVISILLLSLMSPIGTSIGIGVEQSSLNNGAKEATIMVFEGLSVGTFLYVTFFEVFLHERDNEHNNMLKLLVTLLGFGLIAAIGAIGHTHGPDLPSSNSTLCGGHGHSHGADVGYTSIIQNTTSF